MNNSEIAHRQFRNRGLSKITFTNANDAVTQPGARRQATDARRTLGKNAVNVELILITDLMRLKKRRSPRRQSRLVNFLGLPVSLDYQWITKILRKLRSPAQIRR